MSNTIIMYENGKAVGGEGHPTNADEITFDNTGTDLVSNKVGSAIKEVNANTKHGIVELWVNSNIAANFAGQAVTINNYDTTKYDGIILAYEGVTSESRGAIWLEFDNGALTSGAKTLREIVTDGAYFYCGQRVVTPSISGNTLSLTFGDATAINIKINPYSAPTSTDNSRCVPVRILGLIHND